MQTKKYRLVSPSPWSKDHPDSYTLSHLKGYPEFFTCKHEADKVLRIWNNGLHPRCKAWVIEVEGE